MPSWLSRWTLTFGALCPEYFRLQQFNVSNRWIRTQVSKIKTQRLMTWATESGKLRGVFGGILLRAFFLSYIKYKRLWDSNLCFCCTLSFTEHVFIHLYHCGFHAEWWHLGRFVEVGIKQKWNISKSGVWTQISMIETQLFTTWATESGRWIDILDGTLELSFI